MPQRSPQLSRRVFVRSLALAAGAAPWLRCSNEEDRDADYARTGDGGAASSSCPPFLTPTAEFFAQFGAARTVDGWAMPVLPESASASIEGLVATPMRVDLAALEADVEQHVTVVKTMMCVLGYRDTALFTGVPLRVLLDRAGIDRAAAKRVRFFGHDGFENNLRVEDVYDGPADAFEPLLAFRIHGERLPPELGFPFRLLLNDRYGYKNTKWLSRIEVSAEDRESGQYQELGYPDAGVIEPVPIAENLRVREEVPAGPLRLCGFALSGYGGVERVELAVDDGAYAPAELRGPRALLVEHPQLGDVLQLAEPGRFGDLPLGVWASWQATIDLSPGQHAVALRVLDRAGHVGEATTITLTVA